MVHSCPQEIQYSRFHSNTLCSYILSQHNLFSNTWINKVLAENLLTIKFRIFILKKNTEYNFARKRV